MPNSFMHPADVGGRAYLAGGADLDGRAGVECAVDIGCPVVVAGPGGVAGPRPGAGLVVTALPVTPAPPSRAQPAAAAVARTFFRAFIRTSCGKGHAGVLRDREPPWLSAAAAARSAQIGREACR